MTKRATPTLAPVKKVLIESPFKGKNISDRASNRQFARDVCKWAVHNGYNPYASHLFFTQFLNDDLPGDRKFGINLGLMWGEYCDEVWFCYQYPQQFYDSQGMQKAHKYWTEKGKLIKFMLFDSVGNFIREDSEI